jgi:hypothetical protein
MDDTKKLENTMADIANQTNLTSREAAALILSDGRTSDVAEAELLTSAPSLELDGLQRAHLRRMMGFNFAVKVHGSRILVISKEGPHIITRCNIKSGEMDDYGNITSEKLIERLVNACVRLKIQWDAEQMRLEAKK